MEVSGYWISLINVFKTFYTDITNGINFLFRTIPGINISPVMLLTFGGLIIYIGVAVAKWLLS